MERVPWHLDLQALNNGRAESTRTAACLPPLPSLEGSSMKVKSEISVWEWIQVPDWEWIQAPDWEWISIPVWQ